MTPTFDNVILLVENENIVTESGLVTGVLKAKYTVVKVGDDCQVVCVDDIATLKSGCPFTKVEGGKYLIVKETDIVMVQ